LQEPAKADLTRFQPCEPGASLMIEDSYHGLEMEGMPELDSLHPEQPPKVDPGAL